MLIAIYDVLNLVETSIIHDNDFSVFENVLAEVIKIDPSLHNARLLYAKSLLANKKENEAKSQILQVLELNPLNHEAYRILIKIDNKDNEFFNNFFKKSIQYIDENYSNEFISKKILNLIKISS